MSDSTLLSGVGYVRDTIPHDIFAQLTAEASLAREKAINVNRELAGAIKEEYNIGRSDFITGEFFDYIIRLIGDYEQTFAVPVSETSLSYPLFQLPFIDRSSLITTWINYQKKAEYNPPHRHSGSYSFVMWLNIPYDIDKEKELYRSSTDFTFQFVQDGQIQQCPIDPKEGDIILFPAGLWHSVNPFFLSDEFRISISGNIDSPIFDIPYSPDNVPQELNQ